MTWGFYHFLIRESILIYRKLSGWFYTYYKGNIFYFNVYWRDRVD